MQTSLPLRQIADTVCVAPQLTPETMAEVADGHGRPDWAHAIRTGYMQRA